MPAQTVPTESVPSKALDVAKLNTSALEKFQKAIERGYNLPKALKDLDQDELQNLRNEIDEELRTREGGAAPLANREPQRSWTPRTA